MLNENGIRELAYIVQIDDIQPIEGRDRVECAVVGGWTIMVKKGQFEPGDLGIYFEIDSKVPEKEPFMFLEAKHFKIKTQKYKTPSGHFYSQGLLMSADDFGWTAYVDGDGSQYIHNNEKNISYPVGTFLTEELQVKYSVKEDNRRKSNIDKYSSMAQRHRELFRRQPFRWLMKYTWGKKLLFIFFGKKKDSWPAWVKKTDEERVENMTWILNDKRPFIVTEKIDGTSTTFTMKRGKHFWNKPEFYVCSRNVVFDKPDKQCFYETNVYLEMAEKYHMKEVLTKILAENPQWDWVTIQGETFGHKIQKRDYGMNDVDFRAFNFVTPNGRMNSLFSSRYLHDFGVPFVPIIEYMQLPDTVAELREMVNNTPSAIDGGMIEGFVIRDFDGDISFKCVDPEFLMRYHNGRDD